MDVMDARLTVAECDVHRTVVQLVVPDFVEAERDVERSRRGDRVAIRRVEIGSERSRGDRVVANTALQEVSGQRTLGRHSTVGRGLARRACANTERSRSRLPR